MAKRKDAVLRKGGYPQGSVRERILAFFLENLGRIATRDQIQEAARDPGTGRVPENWHQRLSELRTDHGYTILSWRNRGELKVMEYVMDSAEKRPIAGKRVRPTPQTWAAVLKLADNKCAWQEGCGLQSGDIDPIGGGTVKLTPDHLVPHSVDPASDPNDPSRWQPLCGRHQVVKKNYWDNLTGKVNMYAVVQAASSEEKWAVYEFLKRFFGDV